MKNQIRTVTLVALTTLLIAGCGKKDPYGFYGSNYGGQCAVGGTAAAGQIVYSTTGIGTAVRNGVPAQLELTIMVDQTGRVTAAGRLQVPDAGTFFSEGYNSGNPYNRSPIQGSLSTCVSGTGASWDSYSYETSSPMVIGGSNIQIQLGAGVFASSNGLFVNDAQIAIAGRQMSGSITFAPGQ